MGIAASDDDEYIEYSNYVISDIEDDTNSIGGDYESVSRNTEFIPNNSEMVANETVMVSRYGAEWENYSAPMLRNRPKSQGLVVTS